MRHTPKRLGRYELLRHLASGGMARVYLARATGPGGFSRHVVIKTIPAERRDDDKFIAMFLDEARLVATLHHQHIAQVFEVDRADDGTYFLAMEYVHGETVRHVLQAALERRKKLPVELGLSIACAAAAGLHHAHERRDIDGTPLGIVHRDVSPSNLILGYDGSIKLIDFGIAKATLRTTQTATGFIKGKAGYMAPEQARGYAVDRRSDVFALGVLAYELTTQTRAFHAATQFETLYRTTHGDVEPPTKRVAGYPAALEDVIMTALELDPDDRFQDAEAMRVAFEQIARELGVSLGESTVIRTLENLFPTRPEPWLVAGGSLDATDEVTPVHTGSEPIIMIVPSTPTRMRAAGGMQMAEAAGRSEMAVVQEVDDGVPEHIASNDTIDLTTSPFERRLPPQSQIATAPLRSRATTAALRPRAGTSGPARPRAAGTSPPVPSSVVLPIPAPSAPGASGRAPAPAPVVAAVPVTAAVPVVVPGSTSISAQLPLQPTVETPLPRPPLHERRIAEVSAPWIGEPIAAAPRSTTYPIAQRSGWSPLVITGVVLSIGVVVIVIVTIVTSTTSTTTRTSPATPKPTDPTTKPAQPSTPTPPVKRPKPPVTHSQPTGTVTLTVSSDPIGATVVLDGVRLGVTPFSAPVSGKQGLAWLKVRKRGFAAVKTRVSLEHDVSWEITLRHLTR
ncbi:MAG TPA: protein kinase [Kofleriaceae bacterium]